MKLPRSLAESFRRSGSFVAAALLAALFSGCASVAHIVSYPTPNQPVTISVGTKPLSKLTELPIGTYYDEPRQIVVSGNQKGLGWSILFGPVGVLVADSASKSSIESRYGTSARSSATDLGAFTRIAVVESILAAPGANWRVTPGGTPVQLSPSAVFTVRDSGKARLFALLRAEVLGADGKPTWSGRFFARAPGEFPIEGEDGWMKQNRFADGMLAALRQAVQVCMDDTQGKLTGSKRVTAKGVFPLMNYETFEWPFILVRDDADVKVGRLAMGDAMPLAGMHILNKADYVFKDSRN